MAPNQGRRRVARLLNLLVSAFPEGESMPRWFVKFMGRCGNVGRGWRDRSTSSSTGPGGSPK
jgi:hypothetical protein